MVSSSNQFKKKFKKIRESRGLSRKKIAEKLDVARKTIENWENGISLPRVDAMQDMVQKIELTPYELYTLLDETNPIDPTVNETRWVTNFPHHLLLIGNNNEQNHHIKMREEIEQGIAIFTELMHGKDEKQIRKDFSLVNRSDKNEMVRGYLQKLFWNKIVVFSSIKRNLQLEDQLKTKIQKLYKRKIDEVYIADTYSEDNQAMIDSVIIRVEMVSALAAQIAFPSHVAEDFHFGIGAGYTIARFADQLIVLNGNDYTLSGTWLPLVAFPHRQLNREASVYAKAQIPFYTANSIVTHLCNKTRNSTGLWLPFNNNKQLGRDTELYIKNHVNKIDAIYLSVNGKHQSPSASDYREYQTIRQFLDDGQSTQAYQDHIVDNIVGEVLGHIIDKNMNTLQEADCQDGMFNKYKAYAKRLPLNILMRVVKNGKSVFCLAVGDYKAKPIKALLEHGYVNGLVLDSSCAEELEKIL